MEEKKEEEDEEKEKEEEEEEIEIAMYHSQVRQRCLREEDKMPLNHTIVT